MTAHADPAKSLSEASSQPGATHPGVEQPDAALNARDGMPSVIRVVQRFGGVAMSVAGLALLVLPFGASSTTEILCKIMVALVFGFAGAALWQAGSPVEAPEIEVDMVRREIRLMRWRGQTAQLVRRSHFGELARAEIDGRSVRLWTAEGNLLADLTLPESAALTRLRSALADEGVQVA